MRPRQAETEGEHMSNRNSKHVWGRSWKAEMGQRAKLPPMTAAEHAAAEERIDSLLRERGRHDLADARKARMAAGAQA
jgi:hypothetical protein